MRKRLMVERIIDFSGNADELDFETIEQRIATVEVENPDEWSAERLVEKAYSEANMSPKSDTHRITALGNAIEVDNE